MRAMWLALLALVLPLGGCIANLSGSQQTTPGSSQPTESVLIAAVELQFEDPMPGGQSVWLANRGTREQDISCWVMTASSGATAVIAQGTHLAPGSVLRFATPARMLRSPDVVTLTDARGKVVDRTPELKDSASDDQLWYRLPGETWRFGRARLPEKASDGRVVPGC